MAPTKTYQAVTVFFPADPRNAEILFKTQEVYSYLRAHQLKVDPDHIDYLIKHGVIGQRVVKGRGKKHSVQGYWSLPQRELLREALTLEQRDKAKMVDLCVLPVAKWLYWGGPADIALEQVRRAMRTWCDYQHRRTQSSYERTRHDVVNLLNVIGHPNAAEKGAVATHLTTLFYSGAFPDEKTLQEYFAPMIDPDQKGAVRGPQGAPLSAESVSHLLTARLAAIDAIRNKRVPESLWEWARVFYLQTMRGYQDQRPIWLSEVAHDQEVALLFQAHTLDQRYSAACYDLSLVLGMGLLNPMPMHIPVRWRPATWEHGHLTGQVRSVPVPTGLYGPTGYPLMNIHTTVSVDFPEALPQQ